MQKIIDFFFMEHYGMGPRGLLKNELTNHFIANCIGIDPGGLKCPWTPHLIAFKGLG